MHIQNEIPPATVRIYTAVDNMTGNMLYLPHDLTDDRGNCPHAELGDDPSDKERWGWMPGCAIITPDGRVTTCKHLHAVADNFSRVSCSNPARVAEVIAERDLKH